MSDHKALAAGVGTFVALQQASFNFLDRFRRVRSAHVPTGNSCIIKAHVSQARFTVVIWLKVACSLTITGLQAADRNPEAQTQLVEALLRLVR